MVKIIAWIIVIWFSVSFVIGIKNEGTERLQPIVTEYFYQLEKRPLLTIVLSFLVIVILFGILF